MGGQVQASPSFLKWGWPYRAGAQQVSASPGAFNTALAWELHPSQEVGHSLLPQPKVSPSPVTLTAPTALPQPRQPHTAEHSLPAVRGLIQHQEEGGRTAQHLRSSAQASSALPATINTNKYKFFHTFCSQPWDWCGQSCPEPPAQFFTPPSSSHISELGTVLAEGLGMSLEHWGCSPAPVPLGEAPSVISALPQGTGMASVLLRRTGAHKEGDTSRWCLLAGPLLISPPSAGLEAPWWPWGMEKVRLGVSSRGSSVSP